MAAIANLTLVDSASANKTYKPVRAVPVADWKDLSSGISIGTPELTLGLRSASSAVKTNKVTLKLVLPTMEVTSPSTGSGIQPGPTVAFRNLATVELIMHERSSLVERQDLLALIKSALGNAVVTAAVENFEVPF